VLLLLSLLLLWQYW